MAPLAPLDHVDSTLAAEPRRILLRPRRRDELQPGAGWASEFDLRREDVAVVATVQRGAERNEPAVDLGPDARVTDVGVHGQAARPACALGSTSPHQTTGPPGQRVSDNRKRLERP